MRKFGPRRLMVVGLILLAGILPVVAYWIFLGRFPTRIAGEAIALLNQPNGQFVLVDVRPGQDFQNEHVDGAQNWPLSEMAKITAVSQVPDDYSSKTLLLICDNGFISPAAAQKLSSVGFSAVYIVRGGMQEWTRASAQYSKLSFTKFVRSSNAPEAAAFQEMNLEEQAAAVAAQFFIKPLFLMVCLLVIWSLLKLKAPDLVAFRWGMIFFFLGEALCLLNVVFFEDASYVLEYLHSYGMVVSFAFASFGLWEGMDARILHLDEPGKKCAALDLCGACIKYEETGCAARRLFQLLIFALLVLCLLPLQVEISHASYNTLIFGSLFNYAHFSLYQVFELRYCPLLALFCLSLAWVMMHVDAERPIPTSARLLFSAGLGGMVLCYFRLIFMTVFVDHLVWAYFWEEATELIYVIAGVAILWVFRARFYRALVPANQPLSLENILSSLPWQNPSKGL